MTDRSLNERFPTTLLGVFATLCIAVDVVLLTRSGLAGGTTLALLAKYPAALVLGLAVLGARRLAARAAAACAEDLRG